MSLSVVLQPNLKTNDAGVATYQGIPFVVEVG
jgi:hypothetical protein